MSKLTSAERGLESTYETYTRQAQAALAKLGVPGRGRIYFVSSTLGNDNFSGRTPAEPLATVGKALSYTEAANDGTTFVNDTVIFLLPEHAETISAASSLSGNTVTGLYMGVAGTKIIGLGEGNQRPTFTFATSTAASISVAAADCRLENVRLLTDVDTLVTACSLTAAADRAVFKDIELGVVTITSTAAPVDWFTMVANTDNVTFDGITANYTETGTDSIVTTAANRGLKFNNSDIDVTFDAGTGALDATGVLTDSEFLNNRIRTGDTAFSLAAGTIIRTDYGTPDGGVWNYFTVTADGESATWNTVAAHEIATVSGQARMVILPECTEDVTDAGSGTIELGVAGGTATLVAQTTAANLDAGEYWLSTTPATNFPTTSLVDEIINNVDVGYTVGTGALTDGLIVFHIWSRPISSDAVVGVGAGGAFA